MFHQPDLFDHAQTALGLDLPALIERIAAHSTRPRYAFMVLNLIAKAAGKGESAGPYIREAERLVPVRDWLCDALMPMAQRDARRKAIVETVETELGQQGLLPDDPQDAQKLIDLTVRQRVRRSGRCNVSSAVSDLVRAGLVKRHYQGFRVDHHNRGAQREAVYTLTKDAQHALAR